MEPPLLCRRKSANSLRIIRPFPETPTIFKPRLIGQEGKGRLMVLEQSLGGVSERGIIPRQLPFLLKAVDCVLVLGEGPAELMAAVVP